MKKLTGMALATFLCAITTHVNAWSVDLVSVDSNGGPVGDTITLTENGALPDGKEISLRSANATVQGASMKITPTA